MSEEELKERLDELRRRRAELEDARAARAEELSLSEQLEREEQGVLDAQALQAAEAAHGRVGRMLATVETDLGLIVLKRPNPQLYRRFQDVGEYTTEALDKLVRPCLVHPDRHAFDRINDAQPATLLRCANAVATLAGVRTKEVQGKS